MKELAAFACHMLRPRAIRAWWRLGSFECVNWSFDWYLIEVARRTELVHK